ncbi:DegT/DnrJ/EryC1/StrS family aminotransferase, partial [Methylobacterium radiotolerans]|uniref:DegT/DnrJ/EryC1/StrS family aminotransferase n=1 Tax=Methylobacterium radiotolerans TaxID=31998 RepID=UPI001FD9480B
MTPPPEPMGLRSNWQSYCVRLPDDADQQAVMQAMLDRGIATRRGIMCAHLEPPYAEAPRRFALPESERALDHPLLLPPYADMTEADRTRVGERKLLQRRVEPCRHRAGQEPPKSPDHD